MMLRIFPFALLLFLLLGCGGGNGRDNSPPSATGNFSRSELPFTGGTVQIALNLIDPSGISFAELDISPRPTNFAPIPLNAQGERTLVGTVTISLPLNPSATEVVYRVTVRARDTLGNEGTVEIGTLTVRSPQGNLPPLPDPSGAFSD
ncbi:MAG: hypothetical protein NZ805_09180 [Armatimonadetes bacterium]|nr:hypothetical protein [Armatimonadota bacterium]MDW8028376.1 hypothetical protein [Armatimonadota bacterium]